MEALDITAAFGQGALEKAEKIMTKSLMSLKANDVIRAQITDITPDYVQLKLADNSVIKARSLVIPEASIGQTANFLVKSNNNGQIALELLKEAESPVPESLVKNILTSLDLPVSKQNSDIITAMLQNNIPINEENVNKAMFFRYKMPEDSMDDAIFLLKENMPPTAETIDIFKELTADNKALGNKLSEFAKLAADSPESPQKAEFFRELGLDLKEGAQYGKLIKKLFVELPKAKKDAGEIPLKLSNIEKAISSENSPVKELPQTQNLKAACDFMKNVDTTKQFVQIPVTINNKEESCSLYVFGNKKGKNHIGKDAATALISLDTANLGKTDIYIEKTGNDLRFQFRLESAEVQKLVRSNIKTLSSLLKSKNLNLVGVSYLNSDDKFEVQKKAETKPVPKQRFSFDMHV